MKAQLSPFEDYVTSLTELGVFPGFDRKYNGWHCILRNSANTKIMPPDDEICWAETMLDALTLAVERLNDQFTSPEDLRKFIATGVEQNVESILENIEALHGIAPAKNEVFEEINSDQTPDSFFH